jgi:hypothetical protein
LFASAARGYHSGNWAFISAGVRIGTAHNQRGTAEQYIKEGKNAVKWKLPRKWQEECQHPVSTPGKGCFDQAA